MSGYCVKTGALVHLLNTGESGPADLFLVGSALVIRFPSTEAMRHDGDLAHVTHTVNLSNDAWYRRDLATVVVPVADVHGLLILHGGRTVDAQAFARGQR